MSYHPRGRSQPSNAGRGSRMNAEGQRMRDNMRGGGARFQVMHTRKSKDFDPEPSIVVMVLRIFAPVTYDTRTGSTFTKGSFLAGIGEFCPELPGGCKSRLSDTVPDMFPPRPVLRTAPPPIDPRVRAIEPAPGTPAIAPTEIPTVDAAPSEKTSTSSHPRYLVLPTKWSKDEAKREAERFGFTTTPTAFLERRTCISIGGSVDKLPRGMQSGDIMLIKGVNISAGWSDKGVMSDNPRDYVRLYVGFRDVVKIGKSRISPSMVLHDYTAMGMFPKHLPKISDLRPEYRYGKPFFALGFGPTFQYNSIDSKGNVFDVVAPGMLSTSFSDMYSDGKLMVNRAYVNFVKKAPEPKAAEGKTLPDIPPELKPKVQMTLAFNGTINVTHLKPLQVDPKRDYASKAIMFPDWQARPNPVRDRVAFDMMLFPEKLIPFGIGQAHTWHRLMTAFFAMIDWVLVVSVDSRETRSQPLNLAALRAEEIEQEDELEAIDEGPSDVAEESLGDYASDWSVPKMKAPKKHAKKTGSTIVQAKSVEPTCAYALGAEFVAFDAQHFWADTFGFGVPMAVAQEISELYAFHAYDKWREDLEYSKEFINVRNPDIRAYVSRAGVACVTDGIPGAEALFSKMAQMSIRGFYAVYPYTKMADNFDGYYEALRKINDNPEEAVFLVCKWLAPHVLDDPPPPEKDEPTPFKWSEWLPNKHALTDDEAARELYPNAMWLFDQEIGFREKLDLDPDNWPGFLPAVFAVYKAHPNHDRDGKCVELFSQEGNCFDPAGSGHMPPDGAAAPPKVVPPVVTPPPKDDPNDELTEKSDEPEEKMEVTQPQGFVGKDDGGDPDTSDKEDTEEQDTSDREDSEEEADSEEEDSEEPDPPQRKSGRKRAAASKEKERKASSGPKRRKKTPARRR